MSKYSKLFFGEKEYYEILPFRFPIYKDLVAGEAEGVEEIARSQASNTYNLLKIAKVVSERKGIPVKDALDLLGNADADDESIYEFVEELTAIQSESQNVQEQKIVIVTLFMKYRGELKEKRNWLRVDDWTSEDTRSMPSQMLDKIFEFVTWERTGWPEPEEGNEDEAEGKG